MSEGNRQVKTSGDVRRTHSVKDCEYLMRQVQLGDTKLLDWGETCEGSCIYIRQWEIIEEKYFLNCGNI